MKKAANVLFRVGAILSIVLAATCFILGIIYLVIGLNAEQIKQWIIDEQWQMPEGVESLDEAAKVLALTCVIVSVFLFIEVPLSICASIFGFKAIKTDKKALFILNIVFGAISGCMVSVVGGIFALIKGDTIPEE